MSRTSPAATGDIVSTAFVGGSVGRDALTAATTAIPPATDGDVGIKGHMMGVVSAYDAATEQSLLSTWAGAGSGLIETVRNEPAAVLWVTIQNISTITLTIPTGQVVSSADGIQFRLVQTARALPARSGGDGQSGFYTIEPGQSLTVMTQALTDGAQNNLRAGQVTQIDFAGAVIIASRLQAAAPQWEVGTITLVNNSGSTQTISERTALAGSGGSYQIGIDPTNANFVATGPDGSSGYYVLMAGATLTVPVYFKDVYTDRNESALVH